MKNCLIIFLSLMTSSCASTYVIPVQDEPLATIAFEHSGATILRFSPNGDNCTGSGKFPEVYNPFLEGSKPLPIKYGSKVAVHWFGNYGYPTVTYCALVLSFIPKSGEHYKSTFSMNSDSCSSNILWLNKESNEWQPEPTVQKRTPRTPFLESGSFCEPLAEDQ